jgi:hypothetical protein
MQRPLMNGPRSEIRTSTDRPLALFVTVAWLPKRLVRCAAVSSVGVEPTAGRCPAAVIAVPHAILAGDAGFLSGHGDVDGYDAFRRSSEQLPVR